jgi:hypothetical protein
LAIFIELKGLPVNSTSVHLKPHLKKLLKKAHKELIKSKVTEELKSVELIMHDVVN